MSQHDLITELSQISHNSVFAECIKSNPKEAIPMIKAQAQDNYLLVCEIVGERLVKIIENLPSC